LPNSDFSALAPVGWTPRVEALLADHLADGVPGRVVRVERIWCRVVTPLGEIDVRAEVLPAVGDWVVVDTGAEEPAVAAVAERWSALTRMDPHGDRLQILAANIDLVFVTCPADRPSAARVERETVLAWDSGARPVVLVTKPDLDDGTLADELRERLVGVDVLEVDALAGAGVEAVGALIAPDRTAVVLGPSGAGKSTLINALLGEERLPTAAVRDEDARGRHTTTHRELVAIPTGGVVIDTPGLRSLGLGRDMQAGIDATFSEVVELAAGCRFADCAHDREPGCAVTAAVERGDLAADRFASYQKLAKEMAYEERRVDPVVARAEREKWKAIQKAYRANRPRP
jgi:ribosome biogenesis GTPase